jgi:hypothetical protein
VPAGGAIHSAPGRLGHHVRRHYDRHAGCTAGCGRSIGGTPPRSVLKVHETWPGPRLGDGTDFPEERAVVERRKAGGCASPAAASTDAEDGQSAFRRSASLFRHWLRDEAGKGRTRAQILFAVAGEKDDSTGLDHSRENRSARTGEVCVSENLSLRPGGERSTCERSEQVG